LFILSKLRRIVNPTKGMRVAEAARMQKVDHGMNPDSYQTPKTTVKRLPQRGAYDRETIHRILDEGTICHVGFVEDSKPVVIPTIYVRVGERICLHGSKGSRMLQTLAQGAEACITVTLLDGLVLARSAFHHSMNYRSVIAFGTGSAIEDSKEKNSVLHALSEKVIPGRWQEIRVPSEAELNGTQVVAITIREASAKIRTGPPKDDEKDYALPIWAGVLPLTLMPSAPIPDPLLPEGIPVPEHVTNYRRTM
jgi:nitroimidazol reductase NimA-like FMN-containing flavoprotein (pyridoxamine 5'-phosphate oxidase superfamily)